MGRKNGLTRRILYVNGYRVGFGGGSRGSLPTKGMINEMIDYFNHGTPWNGRLITAYESKEGPGIIQHRFEMNSTRMIG